MYGCLKGEGGTSLIELIAGIGLMLIATGLFAPRVRDTFDATRRGTARKDLMFDVARAKNEAAAYGARAIFSLSAGNAGYSVGLDYPPYSSADPPVADSLLFSRKMPAYTTIFLDQALMFDGRGYAIDQYGSLTNTVVTLKQHGAAYHTATVFATGLLQ